MACVWLGHTAAAAPSPRAPIPLAGEQLVVQPRQEELLLGRVEAVTVDVRVEGIPGEVDVAALELRANVGGFAPVRAVGPGRLQTTYLVPPIRYPAVAVILASLSLPGRSLHGSARIVLKSSIEVTVAAETGSMAEVEAAGSRYGPARADAKQETRFDIAVPPGCDGYTVIVTSQSGRAIRRWFDLSLPSWPRMTIGPLPRLDPVAVSDGELAVAAVEPTGGIIPAASITCSSTAMRLARRDSTGEAAVFNAALLPGSRDGEGVLFCRAATGAKADARIGFLPAATHLVLEAPGSHQAGAAAAIVRLTATDSAGAPAALPRSILVAQRGVGDGWSTMVDAAAGAFRQQVDVAVPIPAAFGGATKALIVANSSQPPLRAEATIALQPGAPVRLELRGVEDTLVADSSRPVSMLAEVLDAYGNPAAAELEAAARLGSVGTAGTRVTYRPPSLPVAAEDVLELQSGTVRRRVALALTPAWRWAAHAGAGAFATTSGVWAPATILGAETGRSPWGVRTELLLSGGVVARAVADAQTRSAWWAAAGAVQATYDVWQRSPVAAALALGGGLWVAQAQAVAQRHGELLQPGRRDTVVAPLLALNATARLLWFPWSPLFDLAALVAVPVQGTDPLLAVVATLGVCYTVGTGSP